MIGLTVSTCRLREVSELGHLSFCANPWQRQTKVWRQSNKQLCPKKQLLQNKPKEPM